MFWLAEPIADQPEKSPKFIEPHLDPVSCVVAYTSVWPLYGAVVKSFSDTHPDFGLANAPLDDHRYDDGNEHEPPPPPDEVVVVVLFDTGGRVVVGGGVPGRVQAIAGTASAAENTSPSFLRRALIGR